MNLFLLCSVLIIPIEINCENPSVKIQPETKDQQENSRDAPRFGKLYNRHIVMHPPDDYLVHKLARQYLALKMLERQKQLNEGNCDLYAYRDDNRRPSDVESPFNFDENYAALKFWDTINLGGTASYAPKRPLYAEEPNYVLMRRETDLSKELAQIPELFIPQRGRKEDILIKDEFIPNRGKKDISSFIHNLRQTKKKAIFDDFLDDDLFFPNRGKKMWNAKYRNQNEESIMFPKKPISKRNKIEFDLNDFLMPNRGKKKQIKDTDFLLNEQFIPNRGKRSLVQINHDMDKGLEDDKTAMVRRRRDLLDKLAKEGKDTFYLARGRRYKNYQVKYFCY